MGSRSVLGRDIGEKRVVAEGARLGSYGQPGVSVSRQAGGVGESKQTERTLDGSDLTEYRPLSYFIHSYSQPSPDPVLTAPPVQSPFPIKTTRPFRPDAFPVPPRSLHVCPHRSRRPPSIPALRLLLGTHPAPPLSHTVHRLLRSPVPSLRPQQQLQPIPPTWPCHVPVRLDTP